MQYLFIYWYYSSSLFCREYFRSYILLIFCCIVPIRKRSETLRLFSVSGHSSLARQLLITASINTPAPKVWNMCVSPTDARQRFTDAWREQSKEVKVKDTRRGNSSQRSMDAVLDHEEPMVRLGRSCARPRQHYANQLKKRTQKTTEEFVLASTHAYRFALNANQQSTIH